VTLDKDAKRIKKERMEERPLLIGRSMLIHFVDLAQTCSDLDMIAHAHPQTAALQDLHRKLHRQSSRRTVDFGSAASPDLENE
jgi:hypothetical protein